MMRKILYLFWYVIDIPFGVTWYQQILPDSHSSILGEVLAFFPLFFSLDLQKLMIFP